MIHTHLWVTLLQTVEVVGNEVEGRSLLHALEGGEQSAEGEIVDANGPRGVTLVALNGAGLKALQELLFITTLSFLLDVLLLRGRLGQVLEQVLARAVVFQPAELRQPVKEVELAVEVLAHSLHVLRPVADGLPLRQHEFRVLSRVPPNCYVSFLV
jgi:hypothetical protein